MSGPESRAKFIQPDVIGLNLTMQRILLINDTFFIVGSENYQKQICLLSQCNICRGKVAAKYWFSLIFNKYFATF